MISIHLHYVCMAGRQDTLENIKEIINLKFNIQESGKVKKFIRVHYKSGHDAKGPYAKMTMDKYIKKWLDVYDIWRSW